MNMRDTNDYGSIKGFKDFLQKAGIGVIIIGFGMLPLIMGFTDWPSRYKQQGYVVSIEEKAMVEVSFREKKTPTASKYCADYELLERLKEATEKEELVEIEYGRGWIMPIWMCHLFNNKIITIAGGL